MYLIVLKKFNTIKLFPVWVLFTSSLSSFSANTKLRALTSLGKTLEF